MVVNFNLEIVMDNYPVSTVYKRDPVAKRYNEIVFRPHPSQSSEMNDLQTILNDRLKKYIDLQYSDGDIIKGGFSNKKSTKVYFFDTTVYIRGQILTIDAGSVTVSNSGTIEVGILYKEDYVTPVEDIDLLDPAINTFNYKKRGADRVKYTLQWAANPVLEANQWFYPIIEVQSGTVASVYKIPVSDKNTSLQLAEYDYSTRGSYIVNGVNLFLKGDNSSSWIIGISSGQLRIGGYPINIPQNTSIAVRKPSETRLVELEPVPYTSETVNYASRHYPINNIVNVIGQQVAEEDITHAYQGSTDYLQYNPVVSIVSITSGATTYTSGTDYIIGDDGVKWIGNQPSPGSLFHVKYTYNTDITSKVSKEDIYHFSIPASAGVPTNTIVQVTYRVLLSRKDTISISPDGKLVVSEGVPVENSPKAGVAPATYFVLGDIEIYADGTSPLITYTDQRVLTVADQRRNVTRLDNCEYNISRLGLLMSLSSHQPTTLLKANFVDPLRDSTYMDDAISSCSVSDGYLGLKINWTQKTINKDPVISPYTEEIILTQPKASKSRMVNEFLVISDNTVSVELEPSTYYFIVEYTRTSIYGPQAQTTTINEAATEVYDIPSHEINYSAEGFDANEDVTITIEDTTHTVKADSSGNLSNKKLTTPELKSGNILIVFKGNSSGKEANVTYVIQPIIQHQYVVTTPPPTTINYNTYVTNNITNNVTNYVTNVTQVNRNADPIAQTFQFDRDRDITSVDFYFTKRPTTNVFAMVTETTAGVPDPLRTLDRVIVKPANVKIDGNPTKFTFSKPLPIDANKVYAVLVGCNDGDAMIEVAELGKQDKETGTYITSNTYIDGTLLQASQMSTWTPIQSEDIKLTLRAAKYNSSVYSKNVGTVSVSGITDVMILPFAYTPADSSISIDASFVSDNTTYELEVANPITVKSYSGDIQFNYNVRSNTLYSSPIFYSCQIGVGKIVNPSVYISRQFVIGSGGTFFVYLTSLIPTGCSVRVYYQESNGSYTQMTTGHTNYPDTPMGNNWVERTYIKDNFPNIERTRIKIELSTNDARYRPYCVDLRAVLI